MAFGDRRADRHNIDTGHGALADHRRFALNETGPRSALGRQGGPLSKNPPPGGGGGLP